MADSTSLEAFANSYEYLTDKGELTLLSTVGDRYTVNLFDETNMIGDLINKPVVTDSLKNTLTKGSFYVSEDLTDIRYSDGTQWVRLTDTEVFPNKDRFTIDMYDDSKKYLINDIVSYDDNMYVRHIQENVVGLPPLTFSSNITTIEDMATIELETISGLGIEDNELIINTTNQLYTYPFNSNNLSVKDTPTNYFNDTHRYVEWFDEPVVKLTNRVIYLPVSSFSYVFTDDIRFFYISNNYMYVYTDTLEKFKFKDIVAIESKALALPFDWSSKVDCSIVNRDVLVMTERGTDIIFSYSLGLGISSTIHTAFNINSSVCSVSGELFMNVGNTVKRMQLVFFIWKEVVVDDLFETGICDGLGTSVNFYTHVTDSQLNYSLPFGSDISSICAYGNRYLFLTNRTHSGEVFRLDLSSGLFNKTLKDTLIVQPLVGDASTGAYLSGCTMFLGKLIVIEGRETQQLRVIDPDTFVIEDTYNLDTIISGDTLQAMSSRGDTLYILTNSGKLYKFNTLDLNVTDVVVIQEFTINSDILAIDADLMYITDVYDFTRGLYGLDVNSGKLVYQLSKNTTNVCMTIVENTMLILKREAPFTMMRYFNERV